MSYNTIHTQSKFGPFMAAAVCMFFLTFSAFYSIGFVPYYVDGTEPSYAREGQEGRTAEAATHAENPGPWNPDILPEYEGTTVTARTNTRQQQEFGTNDQGVAPVTPERIVIRAIGVDARIQNPNSTNIDVLDAALLDGPVHYPDSGRLGEDGNMFIFGHSSSLPVVRNPMFKIFNDLPELKEGDTINVHGGGKEYIYRVHTVRLTDANEELVDLSPVGGARLTLSTCNTFGERSERWIVEADLIGAYSSR